MLRTRHLRLLALLALGALGVAWAIGVDRRRRRAPGASAPVRRATVASTCSGIAPTEPWRQAARAADAVGSDGVMQDATSDGSPPEPAPDTATANATATEEGAAVLHEVRGDTTMVVAMPEPETAEPATTVSEATEPETVTADLDRIERDLEGVEAALRRLDDGTYWTDEITGEPLDDALLLADPVARRNAA